MSHRLHRLIGYLIIVIILFFTTKTQSPQREEIEIVFKAPDKQINPYQEEYEKMLYPTVRISSPSGVGSGVVISYKLQVASLPETSNLKPETFILTAAHVVGNENKVEIEFFTTKNTKIDASVVITDTEKDLALLKLSNIQHLISNIYSARLAPKDYTPYLFAPVWAVGCSLGLEPRPSFGYITKSNESKESNKSKKSDSKDSKNSSDSIDYWEVSCPILPGNSGGPVYDAYTYEVIGIAVWVKVYQFQLVTTMAGIVPINEIYEFLDSHRDTEVTEN